MTNTATPENSLLGKKAVYDPNYSPDKLFPIARLEKRNEINVPNELPFFGFDLWNHYEVSWLNPKGKPIVALAEIRYGCESPFIIESKSMKLYFNSFNNSKFANFKAVESIVKKDIETRVASPVIVKIIPLETEYTHNTILEFAGLCLDSLDISCNAYIVNPSSLVTENEIVSEALYSHLLKSNCLVTNQPDWGSLQIIYTGKKINHEGLLRYIVSFRNHNEFHEQCIERIFMDIQQYCQPQELTVYGRYTRRGGLDINPYRSTNPNFIGVKNLRLIRQ